MQKEELSKIGQLINELNSRSFYNSDDLVCLVKNIQLSEEDIIQYSLYNHDSRLSYGRNEIYKNKYFRIYLMSWDANDATAIHDHGNTPWGCVLFFGEASHREYSFENGILKLKEAHKISSGSIVPVEGELIHLMANRGTESICTLHIYGRNTLYETDDAVVFQPEHHRIVTTEGCAYLNMDESMVLSKAELAAMPQEDFQDYLEVIRPFYDRVNTKLI